MVYAEWLARRVGENNADVWLLNTGWTGGPHGEGERFKLKYTRAFVHAILNGDLKGAEFEQEPYFGLFIPKSAPGVPAELLNPKKTWKDGSKYEEKAKKLAQLFRDNDTKYVLPDHVRNAGPKT